MKTVALSRREAYRLMFTDYPDVVDVMQMCRMLGGISTRTGYKLLNSGQIQSYKIGRAFKIPKINVMLYLGVLQEPPSYHHSL